MSLRINSDFNGVTDPDAGAYIAAVEAADGNQLLEFAVGKAINDFVVGCKADGIWNAIKASCILAGARTLSGALVPLAGTAPTNFNFVSGDYNRKTGLVGDGSTKYLNSNRAQNSDPQDNTHIGIYASTAAIPGPGQYPIYIGAGNGTGAFHIGRLENNGQVFIRCRSLGNDNFSPGGATGLIGATRQQSSSYIVRISGANTTTTRSSDGAISTTTAIFANNVGSISGYSNARLAFYSIGESLDLAKLDARVTALINAFGAAIP